jgi:hypothetical protein
VRLGCAASSASRRSWSAPTIELSRSTLVSSREIRSST